MSWFKTFSEIAENHHRGYEHNGQMWVPKIVSRDNQVIEKYFNCLCSIDRTGTIPCGKNILSPIPFKLTPEYRLEEIIDKQANDILNYSKKEDKQIYLLWSGGIDSTVAFYALLKAGANITVVCNDASEKEYPSLYRSLINGEIENVEVYDFADSKDFTLEVVLSGEAVCVTGEIGDQLVGSDKNFLYTEEERQSPAIEMVPPNVYKLTIPSLSKIPGIDINSLTLSEYLWAMNMTFKYQDVQFRKLKNLGLCPIEPIMNCINFFDTKEFQTWSILNYKKNAKMTNPETYKMDYKEYIYNINGDMDYYKNKKKEPSYAGGYYEVPFLLQILGEYDV